MTSLDGDSGTVGGFWWTKMALVQSPCYSTTLFTASSFLGKGTFQTPVQSCIASLIFRLLHFATVRILLGPSKFVRTTVSHGLEDHRTFHLY
jgi:hypothetical protein